MVAALFVAALMNTSAGTNVPVAVFPSDGSQAASPTTQVSFRGAPIKDLTGIEVTGSKTGSHKGRLAAHSDGFGASFLPYKPFRPGETVTVSADPDLIGAGGDGDVEFKIAEQGRRSESGLAPKVHDPGGNPPGAEHFQSAPGLQPPSIVVTRRDPGVAPGHLFLGAKAGPGQDGAMISDDRGRLVWFHRVPYHTSAFDFRAQVYRGQHVLTWWQGPVLAGEGFGEGIIYDDHYRPLATVQAGNGYKMDLHEFAITPENTALIIAYNPIKADTRAVGGPKDGAVLDTVVQEIDIKTGLVEFEWHAFDHIKLTDAFNPYMKHKAYDFAHVNSVFREANGNLLISVRNASAVLEVDHASGKELWRIGGKRTKIPMQPQGFFVAQHSVTRTPMGALAIFDNGAGAPPIGGHASGRPSRGLILRIPKPIPGMPQLPAFVEHALVPDVPRRTFSQGSVQALPNMDYMVGWGGSEPWFSEFSGDGQLIYDAHFDPHGDDSYRVWKLPWAGHPDYPPSVAAKRSGGGTTVYASWNGATLVSRWQVLTGSNQNDLKPTGGPVTDSSFETAIPAKGGGPWFAVRALDSHGTTLGTSPAVRAG